MAEPFAHFLEAQQDVFPRVLSELRAGRKSSHWMWYIFPQLRGLGQSAMAHRFGLAGLDEAARYAAHPVLGARLTQCVTIVNALEGQSATAIFGAVDAMKLRSSLTLFFHATEDALFETALDKYFNGEDDPLTLRLLG